MDLFRRHPEIKGYELIMDYPGNTRPLGTFEPYTTGEFSKYPEIWKVVYYENVKRDRVLKELLN